MQKVLFIASLLVLSAFAFSATDEEISTLWSYWKNHHSKNYSLGEESARFAIFVDNFRKIIKFNAESNNVKLGLNKFADLTSGEFKARNAECGFFEEDEEIVKANTIKLEATALPASVDWRTKGAVTPVKNQGDCGSCWAFSTTGVLEGYHKIKEGTLLSFSEQQIVDCDTTGEDQGCDGGYPYDALTYTAKYGIEQEKEYPYTGEDGTCKYKKSEATMVNTGYNFVTPKSTNDLLTAVVSMPVSVGIEADQDVFQLYTSGVISENCGDDLDHAVLVVGYNTIQSTQAFIVKNSWGSDWGDAGYVYIATTSAPNAGAGVCGILSQPVIPK